MALDLSKIKPGDRLTILIPNGQSLDRSNGKIVQEWKEKTGRVVIVNGNGTFALNMGGRFGTPGFADASNIVAHNGKREEAALLAYQTYQGWLRALKRRYPDLTIEGDKDIAQAFSGGKGVGEWDGATGVIYE